MRKAGKQEKKKSTVWYPAAMILLLLGAALLITSAVKSRNKHAAEEALTALQETTAETVEEEDTPEVSEPAKKDPDAVLEAYHIEIPDKDIDWDALNEVNEDIYAWIYIPNTNVDYPVLQREGEDQYYLEHNIDHTTGYPGCIYTHDENARDFSDPMTVIYGHNMNDGSMFRTLHYFEDGEFFAENRYIYLYLPEDTFVYAIFAAYEFSDVDLLLSFDFITPESRAFYTQNILEQRDLLVHTEKNVPAALDGESHLLTLSTCVNGGGNRRYLVQGVLVNDPYRE